MGGAYRDYVETLWVIHNNMPTYNNGTCGNLYSCIPGWKGICILQHLHVYHQCPVQVDLTHGWSHNNIVVLWKCQRGCPTVEKLQNWLPPSYTMSQVSSSCKVARGELHKLVCMWEGRWWALLHEKVITDAIYIYEHDRCEPSEIVHQTEHVGSIPQCCCLRQPYKSIQYFTSYHFCFDSSAHLKL